MRHNIKSLDKTIKRGNKVYFVLQAVSLTNGINGHDDVSDMEQD